MPPYKEKFPSGTPIQIVGLEVLREFKRSWKYHHPLDDAQLDFAGSRATVLGVAFYHGGDPLYSLQDVPGTWHECCLEDEKRQDSQ